MYPSCVIGVGAAFWANTGFAMNSDEKMIIKVKVATIRTMTTRSAVDAAECFNLPPTLAI
jgi:hypothetical protein